MPKAMVFRPFRLCVALCVVALPACTGAIDGATDIMGATPGAAATSGATGGASGTAGGTGMAPGAGGNGGSTGMVGNGGAGAAGASGTPAPLAPVVVVATTRFARLSHNQWENTVRDLLRLPAITGLSSTFTGDSAIGKFDNNGGSLRVSAGLRTDYQGAAETLAARVVGDPAALAKILPEGLPTDPAARARAFVEGFGLRAFRRPLAAAETARYTALFSKGQSAFGGADAFADGVHIVLEAMLQSPHFLYRTELGSGAPGVKVALSAYELGAKLAFTLANSMPDAMLFADAASGQLTSPDKLRAHADRLLTTAAGQAGVDEFHAQLLRLYTYSLIDKDPKLFPEFSPEIGGDMNKEARLFTHEIAFGRSGGLKDLLTAPFTFVNKRLAAVYKVNGTFTDGAFARVDLNPKERAGLLTLSGFLASNAYRTQVDSIHRGVFVHHNVLCTNLPPPAAGVALTKTGGVTNRDRITVNTGVGTCGAGCHSTIINPVGFAFEHYDALGRYRDTDNGAPVDASDSYVFTPALGPEKFDGALEFSRLAANSAVAHDCYATNLLEFLAGRLPEDADQGLVKRLGMKSLQQGANIKSLIVELVTSEPFVTRLP